MDLQGADPALDLGLCAHIACILEATAHKAGNVHPQAGFADLHFLDFLLSAAAIAPIMQQAPSRGVGETILHCVRATRRLVNTNANLGIVLLLAPLAAVPRSQPISAGIEDMLRRLTVEDARQAYAAIRLANPGGLGRTAEQDVSSEPTMNLREVMRLAAERDLVARQYANGFHDVLIEGLPVLVNSWKNGWEASIQLTHLHLLSVHPDSLIARKRGLDEAQEASRRAGQVLDAAFPDQEAGRAAFSDFDAWLRKHGNSRNPGASADLVTACLFVALREGWIRP